MQFSQEIADEICDRIALGQSLRKICGAERDDFLPGQTTVYEWLASNPAFAQQYAHARERQGDTYAERAVDEALDATDAAIGRLRMDALKWAAGKLAPKKYGDSTMLKHADADGEKLVVNIKRFAPDGPDGGG